MLGTASVRLFADDDFPAGANVLTRLRGTLVRTGLQPDDGLSGSKRFLGEVTFGLVGRFRSQVRSFVIRVFVSL